MEADNNVTRLEKQNLFLQMEAERENLPHVLREDYIPIFVANLLRDKTCSNSEESTLGGRADSDDSYMEEYRDLESSFLLPEQSLQFVHRVLKFAKEAIELFDVDQRTLWEHIMKEVEFPNLELLWLLDAKYHLLSLSNYLMMLKGPPQIQYIQRQFLAFCFSPPTSDSDTIRDRYANVLEHFVHTFLICAYCNSGQSSTLTTLKDLADGILFSLSCKLVANDESEANRQFVLSIVQEVGLPKSVKLKHYCHQLSQLLTTKSMDTLTSNTTCYSLEDVIQYQERFAGPTFRNENQAFVDVLLVLTSQTVMLPTDVLQIISTSIRHPNRNWDRILFLITEWLRKAEFEAASLLKDIIKILMREGISSQNEELVSLSFILARHSSLVSPQAQNQKIFPRYELWYSEMFNESYSPARDLETFSFLVNLLKRWIPFEPSCFLQVQATYRPFIPKAVECRGMWKLYADLALARVAEYNQVEDAMSLEPKWNNTVLQDVETAIKVYEKTRQIPDSVGKMFLLKRKYYTNEFLPALLKKPTGTILSDARLRLIEALNQKDKIPKDMYAAYKKSKK